MKLIKPSFEIIDQQSGLEGVYKQIELAGRTCYKSEDKITETSAKEFVDRMIKSGHGAMLEHGTVYLDIHRDNLLYEKFKTKYSMNKHSKLIEGNFYPTSGNHLYITTNLRVLVENNWLDDLEYICEPTEYHERRYTIKFICDRGVSHEFVRHRVFSFAQESTRYCNYSKDKFGNELTFILHCWCNHQEDGNYGDIFNRARKNVANKDGVFSDFVDGLYQAEHKYLKLLEQGWKAQEARAILPNALKTELVMTGFVSDWKHFFELRDAGSAHPQARELAQPLHQEFITRKYI